MMDNRKMALHMVDSSNGELKVEDLLEEVEDRQRRHDRAVRKKAMRERKGNTALLQKSAMAQQIWNSINEQVIQISTPTCSDNSGTSASFSFSFSEQSSFRTGLESSSFRTESSFDGLSSPSSINRRRSSRGRTGSGSNGSGSRESKSGGAVRVSGSASSSSAWTPPPPHNDAAAATELDRRKGHCSTLVSL